jgi:hypothetical protein
MTKDEYWQAHVKKNPRFEDEDNRIEMSVGMLRRLMMEAYDRGMEQSNKTSDLLKDVFKGLDLNGLGKR